MALSRLQIKSIAGGMSKSLYDSPANTYLTGVGIDPDLPALASGLGWRTSGAIVPSNYAKFSGTEVTGFPLWIVCPPFIPPDHNPLYPNNYVYTSDGKIHAFDDNIVMRSVDQATTSFPLQITNGNGGGFAYYNNYLYGSQYGATGDLNNTAKGDIFRYGGLDQGATQALTLNAWTGATFGLTALTNVTYPIVTPLSINIPNHPMHVHGDNALYIGDVLPLSAGSLANRGCLHRLKTKFGTFSGDTNDGSAYNVFDLPYGYRPTDIESYGTDLVVSAIQCKDEKINQGRAELFFWDCISDSFYNRVTLPDPLVTALYNKNGSLYVFTGLAQGGSRVSIYSGGRTTQTVSFEEEGLSPLAGAVDAYGERMSFGTSITHPTPRGVVVSIGSKFASAANTNAGSGVHATAVCSASTATPVVTAMKYVQQGIITDGSGMTNNSYPKIVMGWAATGANGLDKQGAPGAGGVYNLWRSGIITIGQKFVIKRIIIPLLEPVVAATNISVTLYVDTGSTSYGLPNIVSGASGLAVSGRSIIYKEPNIGMVPAFTDFFLEFSWVGTATTAIALPITFEIDVYDDQS